MSRNCKTNRPDFIQILQSKNIAYSGRYHPQNDHNMYHKTSYILYFFENTYPHKNKQI